MYKSAAPPVYLALKSIWFPREIAETPVRAISTSPSDCIRSMKAATFDEFPVTSNTKLSSVLSSVLARKVSAIRRASIRFYLH